MVITYDVEQGEPAMGFFYRLLTCRADDIYNFDSRSAHMIQSVDPQDEDGEDLLDLRPMGGHIVYWSKCKHNSGTDTRFRPVLEYRDLKEVGNLSWFYGDYAIICKEDLAVRLLTSELRGIVVQKPEFCSPTGYPPPRDWYYVQGGGPHALKLPKMSPEPYKCWNCHNEPVCSVCGDRPGVCPFCEVEYEVPVERWNGRDESKLVLGRCPLIVDLKLWDGSDYFGGLITNRMLQFLLSCHAHPFRAWPIPVDLKGATAEELKRLEVARTCL